MTGLWTVFCRDLWGPVWPNLAASALWTWPWMIWTHAKTRAHVTAELERLRDRKEQQQ